MVGMPLLNLGYALGGLTGGYNQAQTQAMQRAAYQLALQQAQSQQAGRQALARYLQSPDFKGFGGGLGGAFSPGNIQPVSQPAPAPIPGVTTPSPAPPPPVLQQPMSASPRLDTTTEWGEQFGNLPSKFGVGTSSDDDPTLQWGLKFRQGSQSDTPSNGASGPGGAVGPSGPPGASTKSTTTSDPEPIVSDFASPGKPITPQQQANFEATHAAWQQRNPEQRPSSSAAPTTAPATTAPSTTAPASTTSDASSGAGGGGGDSFAIKIPGGPSIPLSQFFGTLDYGELAKGIAKYVPPGTDQSAIYEAVLDLSKLAEGNRTQQQQAGLILRELIKQPFDLEKIQARGDIQTNIAAAHDTAAQKRAETAATSRETVGAGHDATKLQIAQLQQQTQTLNRDARQANFLANQGRLTKNHQDQLDHQYAVLVNTAANLGYREISLRMSAIRGEILTIKGTAGTYSQAEQDRLKALNDEFVKLAARIQPSPAAPTAPAPAQ